MSTIGIDLGTLRATAAYVGALGTPALIADRQDAGEFHTACSAIIDGGSALVGKAAEELSDADPRTTVVRYFKSGLGGDGPVLTDNADRKWSAQGIAAVVLRKLVRDQYAATNEEPVAAVLTVQPRCTEEERRGLREAANVAGLKNVKLVDEPIAVATYHGFARNSLNQTLMVLDVGASGISATLLKTQADGLDIIAAAYREGGGDYIEQAIVELIAEEFKRVHGSVPSNDATTKRELTNVAASIRQQLWVDGKSMCRKTILLSGKVLELYLAASHLQALAVRLKADMDAASRECLSADSRAWADVHRVLLTGGGALLNWVPEYMATLSGRQPADILSGQAREAAAFGAAIMADQQGTPSHHGKPASGAVAPSDLGLTVLDRQLQRYTLQPLIKRGTPLPASAKTTCYTQRADQKRLVIQIGQGAGSESEPPIDLGMFQFKHIENPRKNYPIEVTLSYDAEGIVIVSAFDPETGKREEQVMGAGSQERAAWLHGQKSWLAAMRINE